MQNPFVNRDAKGYNPPSIDRPYAPLHSTEEIHNGQTDSGKLFDF